MKKLWLTLLLAACGSKHESSPSTIPEDLLAKRDLYLKLVPQVQGYAGFIDLDNCDSVLYSSLLRVGGAIVNVKAAQKPDGSWTRNPTRDCLADGGSDSSFSRDMFLGLLWYIYTSNDLSAAQSILDYCQAHPTGVGIGCVFGQGNPLDPKYIISPNLLATLAEIMKSFGMEDRIVARNLYIPESSGLIGFQAHLAVSHILLRGLVMGQIPESNLKVLEEQADRQPGNGLFQAVYHKYTDGDQDAAYTILRDGALFPLDHLPTSQERCEQYLWQRDTGSDYLPCPNENRTHSGVDYLFALKAIEL